MGVVAMVVRTVVVVVGGTAKKVDEEEHPGIHRGFREGVGMKKYLHRVKLGRVSGNEQSRARYTSVIWTQQLRHINLQQRQAATMSPWVDQHVTVACTAGN